MRTQGRGSKDPKILQTSYLDAFGLPYIYSAQGIEVGQRSAKLADFNSEFEQRVKISQTLSDIVYASPLESEADFRQACAYDCQRCTEKCGSEFGMSDD